MKYFLLLFLFLSVGWLHCRSQRVAVSVNALPAIDGAFEAGVSYAIGNKSTVELTGSLRPWKREEKYVNRYWLIHTLSFLEEMACFCKYFCTFVPLK